MPGILLGSACGHQLGSGGFWGLKRMTYCKSMKPAITKKFTDGEPAVDGVYCWNCFAMLNPQKERSGWWFVHPEMTVINGVGTERNLPNRLQ